MYAEMSAPELLQAVADDAGKWADAFVEIVLKGGVEIDQALMIGWFANAIESSYDLRRRRTIDPASAGP